MNSRCPVLYEQSPHCRGPGPPALWSRSCSATLSTDGPHARKDVSIPANWSQHRPNHRGTRVNERGLRLCGWRHAMLCVWIWNLEAFLHVEDFAPSWLRCAHCHSTLSLRCGPCCVLCNVAYIEDGPVDICTSTCNFSSRRCCRRATRTASSCHGWAAHRAPHRRDVGRSPARMGESQCAAI